MYARKSGGLAAFAIFPGKMGVEPDGSEEK
jgi:hypothetical protein